MSSNYTGPTAWPDTRRATDQWLSPEDKAEDVIHLCDLDYDFEDYFQRFEAKQLNDDEKQDFSARVYGMFCRDFFKSGGVPAAIEPWVASYIAHKLIQVLGGVPWHDIMDMPWDEPTPMFTPRGKRAFDIWAGVMNALRDRPDARITDLIAQQASERHVSYETARADYYTMKTAMDAQQGIPPKFLNSDSDL